MAALSKGDLFRIVETMHCLAGAATRQDFAERLLGAMPGLIAAEIYGVYALASTGEVIAHAVSKNNLLPGELEAAAVHWRAGNHPILRRHFAEGRSGIHRLSDCISLEGWREHAMFREAFRRKEYHRHLSVPLDESLMCAAALTFERGGRDFSDREAGLMRALAPVVIRLWGTLQETTERRAEAETLALTAGPEAAAQYLRLREMGISRREAEVLAWIIEGKQNREIAIILGISFRTVQKHIANMLSQLQLDSRHALTIHALRWLQR